MGTATRSITPSSIFNTLGSPIPNIFENVMISVTIEITNKLTDHMIDGLFIVFTSLNSDSS